MAEFVAYARALRLEIDEFLAASGLRIEPSLALVDCGCQPRHFVPAASLDAHTRKCHGHRYYEAHGSHEFFYRNTGNLSATASPTQRSQAPLDLIEGHEDDGSLVEPVETGFAEDTGELATSNDSGFITAIKALATHAAALYAVAQPWRRVPRAFARLPLDDTSEFSALLKPKLERWIKAELARRQADDDDVESELVEYVQGLLDHPEFCHPDLIAVELEEFLGADDVKAFVLALWKYVIIEIGMRVLPAVAPQNASQSVETLPNKTVDQPHQEMVRTDPPAERTWAPRRRRPTYRAKSTRTGPYDTVREILSNSMAQLSEATGRELVAIPVAATQAMAVKGKETSCHSGLRTPAENWNEFTDPLLVRDMARRRGRRERNSREDYPEPHEQRSRSPPHREYRSDARRRSRSRSRSSSRRRAQERSRYEDHDRRRDCGSPYRPRRSRSQARRSRGGETRRDNRDTSAHRRSPPRRSDH